MSETTVRRRGHGEDGIYLDAARNRYVGAISLGCGVQASEGRTIYGQPLVPGGTRPGLL